MNEQAPGAMAPIIRIRGGLFDGVPLIIVQTMVGDKWEDIEADPFTSVAEAMETVRDLLELGSREIFRTRLIESGMIALANGTDYVKTNVVTMLVRARQNVCRYIAHIVELEYHLTRSMNQFIVADEIAAVWSNTNKTRNQS